MAGSFDRMPVAKVAWSPSPLPGQVVFVTSCDENGMVDIAPKSNITVVAFTGPTIGFGCSWDHRTAQNIRLTREFVVNVPGVALAESAWAMIDAEDRFAAAGLSTTPGKTVHVPSVDQCAAHLECALDRVIEFDNHEVFILGTVRYLEITHQCAEAHDIEDRYAGLGGLFYFLEDGHYARLGSPVSVGRDAPTERHQVL